MTFISSLKKLFAPRPGKWGIRVERWRSRVEEFFLPQDVEKALAIIYCESRGTRKALNQKSQASGIFQHKPLYWEYRSRMAGFEGWNIFNARANIATAAWLVYNNRPEVAPYWGDWESTRSCWEELLG